MKRTVIHKLVAFILVLSQLMVIPALAFTSDEIYLTDEQKEVIYEQLEEINSKYDIGEPFSKEDQEFVEKYVPLLNKKSSDIGLMYDDGDTMDFYNYKTSSDGLVTAVVAGIMINDFNSMHFNHAFGADYTTVVNSGRDYVNEIEARVSCIAYGVVGSDGVIGKIYDHTLTASTPSYVLDFDDIENYTGFIVYTVVSCRSIITYDYGTFSVLAVE